MCYELAVRIFAYEFTSFIVACCVCAHAIADDYFYPVAILLLYSKLYYCKSFVE